MTATAIERVAQQNLALTQPGEFSREQIELIKRTVAVNTTDDELKLFLEVCRGTGLNPFQRQIYAIKRKSGNQDKMTIQTGIDGYRLIAARTGSHMGTTDPEFGPASAEGYPEWARVVVRRLVHGQLAEFPATARWSEYVQTKDEWVNRERTGKKIVGDMWAKMPHTMLGKCAEALALRKAFPAELSGVYTNEEMAQADNAPPQHDSQQPASTGNRRVDITREVQQAADTPMRTTEDPALKAMADKVRGMAERVRAIPGVSETDVQGILDKYAWEIDREAAAQTYTDLVAFGKEHAPKPAPTTPQQAQAAQQPAHLALIANKLAAAPYEFTQAQQADLLHFTAWLVDRTAPLSNLAELTTAEQAKAANVLGSTTVDGASLLERWNIYRNPPPPAAPARQNRIGNEPVVDADFEELPSLGDEDAPF